MKKLLMTLALGTFAFANVEAHDCNKKTTKTVKHTKTTQHTRSLAANKAMKPKETVVARSQVCRVLPYKVCKISEDHKTVSCYETMDMNNLTPLNDNITYYGSTGATPNQVAKQTIPTTVIKGAPKYNYCARDGKNRETTCYFNARGIVRDANGMYSYAK